MKKLLILVALVAAVMMMVGCNANQLPDHPGDETDGDTDGDDDVGNPPDGDNPDDDDTDGDDPADGDDPTDGDLDCPSGLVPNGGGTRCVPTDGHQVNIFAPFGAAVVCCYEECSVDIGALREKGIDAEILDSGCVRFNDLPELHDLELQLEPAEMPAFVGVFDPFEVREDMEDAGDCASDTGMDRCETMLMVMRPEDANNDHYVVSLNSSTWAERDVPLPFEPTELMGWEHGRSFSSTYFEEGELVQDVLLFTDLVPLPDPQQ